MVSPVGLAAGQPTDGFSPVPAGGAAVPSGGVATSGVATSGVATSGVATSGVAASGVAASGWQCLQNKQMRPLVGQGVMNSPASIANLYQTTRPIVKGILNASLYRFLSKVRGALAFTRPFVDNTYKGHKIDESWRKVLLLYLRIVLFKGAV